MDSGRVLVALQEQDKWRDRRQRLEGRLRSVQAKKRFLQHELDVVRQRAERLEDMIIGWVEERVPWERSFVRPDR